MPTQEERLSAVEQAQVNIHEAVSDLNHHVTNLIGIIQKQEWDIREMKGSLRSIDGRLNSLEGRFGSPESRFDSLEHRFEAQDKKLDQIMLLLNTLLTKSDQET